MSQTERNHWSRLDDARLSLALLVAGVGHYLGTAATVEELLTRTLPIWQVQAPTDGVGKHIQRVGQSVPGVDCLEEAMVCHVLLQGSGVDSELHLGVAKPASDVLESHAWVTVGDRVLVGGDEDLSYYTPLPLEQWP